MCSPFAGRARDDLRRILRKESGRKNVSRYATAQVTVRSTRPTVGRRCQLRSGLSVTPGEELVQACTRMGHRRVVSTIDSGHHRPLSTPQCRYAQISIKVGEADRACEDEDDGEESVFRLRVAVLVRMSDIIPN
jgi:hypothetical protein